MQCIPAMSYEILHYTHHPKTSVLRYLILPSNSPSEYSGLQTETTAETQYIMHYCFTVESLTTAVLGNYPDELNKKDPISFTHGLSELRVFTNFVEIMDYSGMTHNVA